MGAPTVDPYGMHKMTIRRNPKAGDFRPYPKTAAPVGDNPEAPQRDMYDKRIAWWVGHRIYLGVNTRVSRLFWLLAEQLGIFCPMHEIQAEVDGYVTNASLGHSAEEIQKADQRLRQTLSRLRGRLREANVDDHVFIHRELTGMGPGLMMYRRFPDKSRSSQECAEDESFWALCLQRQAS